MFTPEIRLQMLFTMLLFLFSLPLAAQDSDQPDWTGFKDQWGQVLFCQLIYKMPEVQSRLYNFDIEECDKAEQLMSNEAARYSKQDQAQIKIQAEQHAYRLTGNTSDPYNSVAACRDYCRELTETVELPND